MQGYSRAVIDRSKQEKMIRSRTVFSWLRHVKGRSGGPVSIQYYNMYIGMLFVDSIDVVPKIPMLEERGGGNTGFISPGRILFFCL